MNVSTAKGTCFLKNQVSFISNFPGIYLIRRLEAEAKGENTRTANSRVETIGRQCRLHTTSRPNGHKLKVFFKIKPHINVAKDGVDIPTKLKVKSSRRNFG